MDVSSINWIAVIGAAWAVYGLAGILGIQKTPPEFAGKSWLKEYKRKVGLSNLLLGVLWLAAGLLLWNTGLSRPLRIVILVVLAIPPLVLSVKTSQKYHDLAEEEKKAEQYFDPYGGYGAAEEDEDDYADGEDDDDAIEDGAVDEGEDEEDLTGEGDGAPVDDR